MPEIVRSWSPVCGWHGGIIGRRRRQSRLGCRPNRNPAAGGNASEPAGSHRSCRRPDALAGVSCWRAGRLWPFWSPRITTKYRRAVAPARGYADRERGHGNREGKVAV